MVLAASAAFACTNLAELNLSSPSGQAGMQVTVTGSAFAKAPKNTPVELHWNGLNGTVLASVTPDAAGAIGPMTIATGLNPWGIPTRAGFQVLGPGATPGSVAAPVSTGLSNSSGVSGGFVALTVALGVGGLVLFGLGAAAFLASSRRRVATPSRVRSR
jgi:hypothetical protein